MREAIEENDIWLEFCATSKEEDCATDGISFAAYHSRKIPSDSVPPKTLTGLLPLDVEEADSYQMVKKCLDRFM